MNDGDWAPGSLAWPKRLWACFEEQNETRLPRSAEAIPLYLTFSGEGSGL